MIDLHTHILFDCDHGVKDKKTYTKMIKKYAKQGFDTVVLTPHLHHPNAECKSKNIKKNFVEAKKIAKEYGVDVYLGCELYFNGLSSTMDVIPIGERYLLVEFPTESKPPMLEKKLAELQERGYTLIIAHVERYSWLTPKSKFFEYLLETGCLISVNLESVRHGRAKPYLKTRRVNIIASDNHGDFRAPKKLRKVLEKYPDIQYEMDDLYFGE